MFSSLKWKNNLSKKKTISFPLSSLERGFFLYKLYDKIKKQLNYKYNTNYF